MTAPFMIPAPIHSVTPKLRFTRSLFVLATGFLATACGTVEAPSGLQPEGPQGRVRFVNVITDTTRGRVNAILERVPFGVNMTYTTSTPASLAAPSTAPYAALLAGDRSIILKRTVDTTVIVATLPFTIASGENRSVYAIGGAAGSAVTAFVTTDDNTAAAATQTRLRVVQLSPTAANVDVFITAVGADLAAATPSTTVSFRGASTYIVLTSGTYQIRMAPAGTSAASRAASVLINVASTSFPSGSGRTIVAADNNVGGAPLRAFILTDR